MVPKEDGGLSGASRRLIRSVCTVKRFIWLEQKMIIKDKLHRFSDGKLTKISGYLASKSLPSISA